MKQKIVGTYMLNDEPIVLALREGTGGDFTTRPETKQPAIISVGAGGPNAEWRFAVGILLHEAGEFVAVRMGLRYRPSGEFAMDNGSHVFLMTHTQYSELTARVGEFLAECLPDLCDAWRKWKKG